MKVLAKGAKILLPFLVLFIVRLALTDVYVAEVGDTYDFMTLSRAVREFRYPETKRLPMLPILLAPLPEDHLLLYSRLLMAFLFLVNLVLIYKLAREFLDENLALLVMVVTGSNFVFFNISLRVLSEMPYVLFFLLALCAYLNSLRSDLPPTNVGEVRPSKLKWRGLSWLGLAAVFSGLACLTRMEGALLVLAVLTILIAELVKNLVLDKAAVTGLLVSSTGNAVPMLLRTKFLTKRVLVFGLVVGVVVLPYLFYNVQTYGNPFYTGYVSDPSGVDSWSLTKPLNYLASVLFGLGSPLVVLAIAANWKNLIKDSRLWVLLGYTGLGLALLFGWGLSMRLFTALIPLGAILFFISVPKLLELRPQKLIYFTGASLALYTVVTYWFRFFELGPFKYSKGLVVVLNLGLLGYVLWSRKKHRVGPFGKGPTLYVTMVAGFLVLISLSIFVDTIRKVRYHYQTLADAVEFLNGVSTPEQKVAYSDRSGLTKYYLKHAVFYDLGATVEKEWEWVQKEGIVYLLDTDEIRERPWMEILKEEQWVGKMELVRSFSSPWVMDGTRVYKAL